VHAPPEATYTGNANPLAESHPRRKFYPLAKYSSLWISLYPIQIVVPHLGRRYRTFFPSVEIIPPGRR
jgi:hypothetical protein